MKWLKNRGLAVRRISEVGLKGAKDEEIARYAIANDMLILTLDTDFAYIYHEVFRGSLGIIVVRVDPPTAANIIEILDKTFEKVELDEFDKKLTIITRTRVRMIV